MKNTLLKITLVLVILLDAIGFAMSIANRGIEIFAYYTQNSNLVALVSAVCLLVYLFKGKEIPKWVTALRYLSSCMLLMTALITIFVLSPMVGNFSSLLLQGSGLFHHTLVPLFSILSYIFLEEHLTGKRAVLVPLCVTFVYGIIMFILNGLRLYDGPYPFFKVYDQTALATALWIGFLLIFVAALSGLVLFVSWLAGKRA